MENSFESALIDAKRQHSELTDIDWQIERLGKFTASRLGELMTSGRGKGDEWGQMAENYIYEKIAERLTGVPNYTPETMAMQWGSDHEDEAIDKFENQTGVRVQRMAKVFIKFNDFAGGSPDGFVDDDTIIEVKCPYNSARHIKNFISKKIDKDYMYQCQGNLLFSGREKCIFISYDPRMPEALQLAIIPIERDEVICNAIAERITQAVEKITEIITLNNLKF